MFGKLYFVALLLLIKAALNASTITEMSCYVCSDCPGKNKLVKEICKSGDVNADNVDVETTTIDLLDDLSNDTTTTTTIKPIYEYACYSAKMRPRVKNWYWRRGCVPLKQASTFCTNIEKNGEAKRCKLCFEPDCNSSSKFTISIGLIMFLAVLVYNY